MKKVMGRKRKGGKGEANLSLKSRGVGEKSKGSKRSKLHYGKAEDGVEVFANFKSGTYSGNDGAGRGKQLI